MTMAASWSLWLLLSAIAWSGQESHAQGCGIAPLNIMNRLVGGEASVAGNWPWQVSLHISTATVARFHTCGGTLLNQQWVLTAAHCIQTSAPQDYTVFLGWQTQQGPNPNGVQRGVRQIIIHPSYNSSSFQTNDLALLALNSSVQFTNYIRPICLAGSASAFSNVSCFVTGWGKLTESDTAISNVLQQALVPVVDQGQCQSQFQNIPITSAMLCAGEQGKGICQGDSGGPLICQQNSIWIQVGIASFGQLCANGAPDVYTRVPNFQNWISSQVGQGGGPSVGFETFNNINNINNSPVSGVHKSGYHCPLFFLLLLPMSAFLG